MYFFVKRIHDFLFKYTTNKLKEAQSNLMSKDECTKKIKQYNSYGFQPKR